MNPRNLNIPQNGQAPQDLDQEDILSAIDFDKIIRVIKQNLVWIILIFLLVNTVTYLYIRYTKPIYESESTLKLDLKSEASLLGIRDPLAEDMKGMSGEIELLKSRLFMGKVADQIEMDVSYFHPGRSHLVDERFRSSPFEVSHRLKNNSLYNKKFDLEIIDDESFELKYELGGKRYETIYNFGDEIENDHFNFLVEKTSRFDKQKGVKDFYFIVNSKESLINYLVKNVKVQPINISAKTIKISIQDPNPHKAQHLINTIGRLYLDFTKETKNQAAAQKISFMDSMMLQTANELEAYEKYFENFTIENRTTNLSNDVNRTITMLNQLDSQKIRLRKQLINYF